MKSGSWASYQAALPPEARAGGERDDEPPPTPREIADDPITLSPDEVTAVWAALWAMVEDVHAPQDQLSANVWAAAESLFRRLDAIMNARPPRDATSPA